MAASSTSLDLLSQAAALVNMAPSITTIKSSPTGAGTKDLPTRGKKLIRTRSRRNLPITSANTDNKTREKNGGSPQLSPKKDPSLLSFAYIFPKAPPSEDENVMKCLSSSYPPPPPYTRRGESVLLKSNPAASSYPRESFYKSPPSPPVFVMETSSNEDDAEDDRPLDMSKKCGRNDSRQQVRPSVITCASALYSSKCHHTDQACLCSPNQSSPPRKLEIAHKDRANGVMEHKGVQRWEISSGMSDPVIDEHFRRSLGKEYSEIFASTTSNSVSVTVDDHFAKALGDTWLRLQQPDNKDCNKTTANSLKHTPSLVTL